MKRAKNPAKLPLENRFLASCLEGLLGLKPLAALYERWQALPPQDIPETHVRFLDHVLGELDTSVETVHGERLEDIPETGPLVICANHPFGGLEGMQLAHLLLERRPDLKVLTNEILTLIPEFEQLFIGVDVLSGNSTQKNVSGMKKVSSHLKSGGALLIFPAGIVASFEAGQRAIVEKPWTPMLGRLIRKYQAACLPLHVAGRNSLGFHILGLIHPRLRTAMLARELCNKRGKATNVVVGALLKAPDIAHFTDDKELTDYLRLACDSLGAGNGGTRPAYAGLSVDNEGADNKDVLETTLAGLQDCLLLTRAPFDVYCVPFDRMGPLAGELARVREQTFRAAGEGTGKEWDSDGFDPHYLHLFVWDREAGKLVGSYRMGKCDEIIASHGVRGLYSRSLFKYKKKYIERLGGAVEVGRSFVSLDYQRNPRALDMLWRGIGTFIVNNPRYHTLFGCVSISSEHSLMARAFLSDTMLTSFAAAPEFLTDIKPVSPLRVKGKLWTADMLAAISDIAAVNKLVGNFDAGKSVPVLLRHYLALNGRFVSFSVNHGFNQALDGLILVDLRNSPMKYLQRYLGPEGAEAFINRWKTDEAVA